MFICVNSTFIGTPIIASRHHCFKAGEVQLGVNNISIIPPKASNNEKTWIVSYTGHDGLSQSVQCHNVVTTVRGDLLPPLFNTELADKMSLIATTPYAPITEVCVGFDHLPDVPRAVFGVLIPSIEKRAVLGILFPSSCFKSRTPYPDSALFTIFMGGLRTKELVLNKSQSEQKDIALQELYSMMKIPNAIKPNMVHIACYNKAIPQYDVKTDQRHQDIKSIQDTYDGLYLAGGIIGGIGMANRITQGIEIGKIIAKKFK